jgi:molybdate transport system substrate-binding protein
MNIARVVALIAAAAVVAGCAADTAGSAPRVELTVFAAASLATALDDATAAYAAIAPDVRVVVATGSSTTLRAQIEAGAPADLFLSADRENPRALAEAGLADGTAVPFAANTLVVATPTADPGDIATPADLARPGVSIVAAASSTPIDRYATAVLAALAALPGYPADFVAAAEANVVSRESDSAAVAAKLELGEADAAILFATEVAARPGLRAVAIPEAASVVAAYDGVVVLGAARPVEARAFLEWLAGPAGRVVLAGRGFLAP